MEIAGWIIWGLACFVLSIHILLIFFGSDPGTRRLAMRYSLLLIVGLGVTAFLNVSKLHLLWWLPITFVFNLLHFQWSVKKDLMNYMRDLPNHRESSERPED
ncbi:MAG: hypothetical protein ACKVRN_04540 [Pyrinomonadaceae bacterium]